MAPDRAAAPVPPRDPRADWDLPGPGDLPVTTSLAPTVRRVLAPNPSPMTLDGTNTYIIGGPGGAPVVVVDPGPDDPAHEARVVAMLRDLDVEVRAIVLTHHHLDHAAAAGAFASRLRAPVLAADPSLASPGQAIGDGDRFRAGDQTIEVVSTPGHTGDHLALRLEDGAVLTGDHVLGRGTSVVSRPDGDLAAYLLSLRRVLDLGPSALHPGHGPSLTEDPTAVLEYYLAHRRFRERQLLHALAHGPATVPALVETLYADVDRRVWPAATASLTALVTVLAERGEVRRDDAGRLHLAVDPGQDEAADGRVG